MGDIAEIAQALTARRKARGLRVKVIARKAGVSPRALYSWERRERHPQIRALVAWAKALDMTLALRDSL